MKWIYDVSMLFFRNFLELSGTFFPKKGKLVLGRANVFPSLTQFVKGNKAQITWFHAASLGEYEQSKPVIREFKNRYPDWAVVLSFFSPSGYEHVVKKPQPHIDFITYLPFDTPKNAEAFVGLLNPKMVFFVKYDLWANFIFTIKRKNIPLFLFSASFRNDQVYFRKYGSFFRKVLYAFDHIFVQNQKTGELLKSIKYNRVTMAGDTRFDNVHAISKNPKSFPLIPAFMEEKPLLVVGSVWEEDMALLIPLISAFPQYKFIIAPHDIDPKSIRDWQSRISRSSIRFSDLETAGYTGGDVLFIDNIGMLSSLYQYARIAYIGGAFGKGLHNILEALAFGIPVFFGALKKKSKFPEAATSQAYGCGFEVKNAQDLHKYLIEMEVEQSYLSACKAANKMVADNLGSAAKIMDQVQEIMMAK